MFEKVRKENRLKISHLTIANFTDMTRLVYEQKIEKLLKKCNNTDYNYFLLPLIHTQSMIK